MWRVALPHKNGHEGTYGMKESSRFQYFGHEHKKEPCYDDKIESVLNECFGVISL